MKQKKEWERLWAKSSSGYSNSSQKCSKQLLRALSSSSCLLPSILQYTTSVGGKSTRGKKEGQSYTNSYKRERGFFSIIISQAWPPKEVTRLATATTVVLYTTGSFPSPLLYGPSTLQTNGKARYVKTSHSLQLRYDVFLPCHDLISQTISFNFQLSKLTCVLTKTPQKQQWLSKQQKG